MNKDQKAIAAKLFDDNQNNKDYDELFMNPKGEFFTVKSYANHSLPKDKNGEKVGKLETIKRPVQKAVEKSNSKSLK